ncbi:hypothetical protein [Nannocystis radixulma]|uniref:Uncharacterized protein n=1 Tax=Nannocystis radixulma TaxID=2995305 RepID=A0ABT5AZ60_9BACT|nr:hypothetical protein [Nannocystis radixulma]MDC0667126.1 hypothetical protein [Nannocystis radixulma]
MGEQAERALGSSWGLTFPIHAPPRSTGAAPRAHEAPIQRTPDPALTGTTAEVDPPRPGIDKFGFIDHSDGANIRTRPAELGGEKLTAQPLPPTTRVFVGGRHPEAREWLYVTAWLAGAVVRGYVQELRVNTDLPEFGARLYQIEEGDTVEGIARREFSASVTDGHDLRFYENVLLSVNAEKGRGGIKGAYQSPNIFGGGANNIQLEAGRRIWLVSPDYALSLKDAVPDGSLTNGAYAKTKRALGHVQDIVRSVTESPQHLGTVAGEYAEVIKAHLPEIVGITAAFILAEAASMLLAATPTGVTQIAALVIQLGLAAFGAAGMVAAGVEALAHAEKWLTLAWTASGDAQQLEDASKEFLKMLVSIAMAALAAAGVRGNFQRGTKIASAIEFVPPRLAMAENVSAGGAIALGGPVFIPGSVTSTGPVLTQPTLMAAIGRGGGKVAEAKKKAEAEAAQKQAKKPAEPAEIRDILGREPDAFEALLFRELTTAEVREMVKLLGGWSKRSFDSAAESVYKHARRKGFEALNYLRKVSLFNKRGARRIPTTGFSETGTYRLEKGTGEYVILEQGTNKIVTYGYNPRSG